MQQKIQRMVDGLLRTALVIVAIYMERETRHCLGKDADAGVDGGHLHGAERAVTAFPEEVPPIKKVYPPPTVLFEGLSLERNSPEKIPIIIISLNFQKTYIFLYIYY